MKRRHYPRSHYYITAPRMERWVRVVWTINLVYYLYLFCTP